MAGLNLYARWMRMNNGVAPPTAADLADLVDTSSAFSQVPAIQTATGASGVRVAHGTGSLVTGTVIVATGLSTVVAFAYSIVGTGATVTGATEVERLTVSSITTGAVSVAGSYHSGTAAVMVPSASGTATFYWIAIGT